MFLKKRTQHVCVSSGSRCGANEILAVLGCYAALVGSYLPTFRDNLSVPSSKVKQTIWPLKLGHMVVSKRLQLRIRQLCITFQNTEDPEVSNLAMLVCCSNSEIRKEMMRFFGNCCCLSDRFSTFICKNTSFDIALIWSWMWCGIWKLKSGVINSD
jgi:hypothetical protein